MCYCPTPTLHLNLALTGDGAFQLSPKKTYSVWFISILNYGDTENVLINHLLLVIPMSYLCHYTNLCPHKPHKHAHTHTHTHTQRDVLIYGKSAESPHNSQKQTCDIYIAIEENIVKLHCSSESFKYSEFFNILQLFSEHSVKQFYDI